MGINSEFTGNSWLLNRLRLSEKSYRPPLEVREGKPHLQEDGLVEELGNEEYAVCVIVLAHDDDYRRSIYCE